MKHLTEYIADSQTKCFERNNVFFAFSDKQFDDGKKDGVKYVSLGSGMLCDISKVKSFKAEHAQIVEDGIQQDIAENGADNIIARELSNHEAYYTGDITDTSIALQGYPITSVDIMRVYREQKELHIND